MDYYGILNECCRLKQKNIMVYSIGETILKRKIYCFRSEKPTKKRILFVASIHAREHITGDLILKILEEQKDKMNCDLYVLPLVNPDGVELCTKGIFSLPKEMRDNLVAINRGLNFSMWKANVRGVDINNNFDAGWSRVFSHRKKQPSSQGFYGKYCESERETRAIVDFISKNNFSLVVAFHTKGEELYFEYFNKNLERDRKIAQIFAKGLKYKIKNYEKTSSAGLKDWCVEKLNIPSFTLECGSDKYVHPIAIDKLNEIYKKFKCFYKMVNKSIKYLP